MAEAATSSAHAEKARERLAAGDLDAARREAEAIVAGGTSDAERGAAHLVLAACCEKAGDAAAALAHARSAVACAPSDPLAHFTHAGLQETAGDTAGAIASLRRALELEPRFAAAQRYIGILLSDSGDVEGAVLAFEQALRLDPNHASAWNNLASAQRMLGRLTEAAQSLARALTLRPDYPLAVANLAEVQRDQGEAARAEATLRAGLAKLSGLPASSPIAEQLASKRSRERPESIYFLILLAGLLRERGALDEAVQLYREVLERAPQEAGAWFSLGWALGERGETDAARAAYVRARTVDPGDLRNLFAAHLTLPMIYSDGAALRAARDDYRAGLRELETELPSALRDLSEARALDGLRWTNFFLAYQGEDDCALQSTYAALAARVVETAAPRWRAPLTVRRANGRRVRVGFASAFFRVGTCGRYFQSWITDLDRDRFEVFVYHLFPGMDEVASAIERRADRFRSFGGNRTRPSIVAPAIRADDLDVLIYPELGMDAGSFALGALRLAPRQYAAWGHPVTSGHATIDAVFSCETMEPAGGEAHYIERLIRLPGIGTRYQRPQVPSGAARRDFGLPEDRALLLCPQSLWKIHPDNDALFAELLAANRDALLLFFSGRHPAVTDQFMRRLERALSEYGLAVGERVRILPQVGHYDYLRINLVCDAMLDTLHWSGGNTSLDALACGLPIVTLPGSFMRGRQSAGMLGLLGATELIARDRADYLQITARLVADAAWRGELAATIRAGQDRLFDVSTAIEVLQNLLQSDEPLA